VSLVYLPHRCLLYTLRTVVSWLRYRTVSLGYVTAPFTFPVLPHRLLFPVLPHRLLFPVYRTGLFTSVTAPVSLPLLPHRSLYLCYRTEINKTEQKDIKLSRKI